MPSLLGTGLVPGQWLGVGGGGRNEAQHLGKRGYKESRHQSGKIRGFGVNAFLSPPSIRPWLEMHGEIGLSFVISRRVAVDDLF